MLRDKYLTTFKSLINNQQLRKELEREFLKSVTLWLTLLISGIPQMVLSFIICQEHL